MTNIGLTILRVVPAALMATAHGWGKLISFPEKMNEFADPIGLGAPISMALAVSAEFFCSVLLVLGIATRLAAIPLVITMLVAAFVIHAQDPFYKQEFPLLYALIFLTLIFTGGGNWGFGNRFKSKWLRT